jgi:uncharacterized protein
MILSPSKLINLSASKIPNAGLGVFANTQIKTDTVIETCPVLVLPVKDYPLLKQTKLRNYYFMWGKNTCALCFGFGSFYNHSFEPNATYRKNTHQKIIEFVAIKDIHIGEEITVNYNYGNPNDKRPLWISDIPPASK